jgi:hypothetical protein
MAGFLACDARSVWNAATMALDRCNSLPGFHSHCFASLALGSVLVGFLLCESVLPSASRLEAETKSVPAPAIPWAQSPRLGIDPGPCGLIQKPSLSYRRSGSHRFPGNSSQWLVDLLGDPDPMH